MKSIRVFLARCLGLFRGAGVEDEMNEELKFHIDTEIEFQMGKGLSRDDARHLARKKFGGLEQTKEIMRETKGIPFIETTVRDIRHGFRDLTRSPGFALTAIVTLALGIGANTAMFGIVYGMLLRPLPYPDPEAIVRVGESFGAQSGSAGPLLNRSMLLLQEDAESFEQLAAYRPSSVEWGNPDGAVTLSGTAVSPALFPLLRATPHLGRLFTEGEAREGAERVVLLSHRAWITRFASDPDIVGTALDFDGNPHIVVGVLAEGFYFPSADGEFWTPFVIQPATPPIPDGSGRISFSTSASAAIGRLAPGVSLEQATAEASTIMQRSLENQPPVGRSAIGSQIIQLAPGVPPERAAAVASAMIQQALIAGGGEAGDAEAAAEAGAATGRSVGNQPPRDGPLIQARVIPLLEEIVGGYRPALLALTAATALILLIACSNVAGLLLARGVTRQRALAVCGALGAGRGRLMRQLLTESLVLSLGGGALGLAMAVIVLRVVPALVPGDIARLNEVGTDSVTLLFTIGLSVVVGLLFGAVPAFQWSRLHLVRTLNEESTQAAGGFRLLRSNRGRAALATAQVALAVVLLVGAGLLLRSFVGLITLDRGYDPANVITARIQNPDLRPGAPATTREAMDESRTAIQLFRQTLLEEVTRLEGLPGVEAVGLSSNLPLARTGGMNSSFRVVGRPAPSDPGDRPFSSLQLASPGYFDVMRLRLREGRTFTGLDRASSPPVLVINETFAREFFSGEPAVGQRVLMGRDKEWEIIGVVADIRYEGLIVTESEPEAFISLHQAENTMLSGPIIPAIAVRTAGDPLAAIPFLQEAVTGAHPRASLDDVMTMDARLSAAVVQPRFYAVFAGCFAALALILAALGIYGLLSYTVSQRRREIGVRMALGAQRGDILTLVVRQGGALVAAGAVLGMFAAALLAHLLESFLFGVTTDDRLTFLAAPLVLVAVALVACWLPALRATRINPMDALRVE